MHLPAWFPIFGPVLGRRRSHRELLELAKRWGLQFIESDMRYAYGGFKGTFQGYQVQIEPDVPWVLVKLNCTSEDFMLQNFDIGKKRHGYDLGHPKFERVFKTMELSQKIADTLRGRVDLFDRVLALFRYRVTSITLCNQFLRCDMYKPFRRPRGSNLETWSYMAADELKRILPEMIEVVRLLESVLSPNDPSAANKPRSPEAG